MGGFDVAMGLQAAQLVASQRQYNRQARVQADQATAQNALLMQQQQQRAKQQRDLLAKQMASARARLAAGGIGVGSGSGQALLAGMAKETESEIADANALLQTRQANAGIGQGAGDGLLRGLDLAQRSWNLLGGVLNSQRE